MSLALVADMRNLAEQHRYTATQVVPDVANRYLDWAAGLDQRADRLEREELERREAARQAKAAKGQAS